MNRTFLEFNDKAIASGIGDWEPGLAGDLKRTVGRFIDYARSVAPDSEAEDGEHTSVHSARVHEPRDIRSNSRGSSPSTAKLAVRSQSLSPRTDVAEIVTASALGYETTYRIDDGIDVVNSQSPGFNSIQNVQVSSLDNVIWDSVEPIPSYRAGFPEPISNIQSVVPPLTKSLPPPSNYSYQETSFARRLLRSTLQNGIRLLTDPNASREQVLRFFRFTFTWTTRPRCLAKLKELISSTAYENLEIWTAPQRHVGNSGLHYPRVGFDMGSSPPSDWAANAPMGPRRPGPIEMPLASSLKPEAVFEITGLGGTWLDSNDVDQYLQNRGIFLDGHSNWAEVDLTVEPTLEPNLTVGSPTNSSRNSSGGPQSPQNADIAYPDGPVTQSTEYFWDSENLGMPNFSNTDMDMFLNEQGAFDPKSLNPPGLVQTNTYSTAATRPTASKKLYLDVEKFVKSVSPLLLNSRERLTHIIDSNCWWLCMPWPNTRIPSEYYRCCAQLCNSISFLRIGSLIPIVDDSQAKETKASAKS